MANWEVLAFCEDYQTKKFDTKGKMYYEFLEDFFITAISQLLQKSHHFWSL